MKGKENYFARKIGYKSGEICLLFRLVLLVQE